MIPDTNSIIYSIKQKIDLKRAVLRKSEVGRILVLDCVMDELRGLSNTIADAKTALALADTFEGAGSEGSGDDCIMLMAQKLGAIVLTNDRELIERLKNKGIRVISIRSGKTIDFV